MEAEPSNVPLTRSFVGRLSAYYSANVTARVSGVLVKRLYTEGSEVKAGQTLFEIDPAYYQTVLNTDLATLAQDQATYVNDRVTADRYHKLLPIGSVSQQTVDDADAAQRSAAAKVKADEAAVEGARVNLGYTKVTSPITGIAGQQQVTAGAVVGNGTTDAGSGGTLLATVEQIGPLYVNFTISAADLITLKQAQSKGDVALAAQNKTTVQVILPNGTPYDQQGTLDFTDVSVNATTGAVSLRAQIPNPQHQLLPGMYVSLDVDLGQRNDVYLVPQQAIQRDTVGSYAMVVGADGKVVRKDVDTNDSHGSDWIVTGGLAAGDRVIVTGVQSVREGMLAKATPWRGTDKDTRLSQSRPVQSSGGHRAGRS
ncbi:Toluene efflux pump periplasmic linker protein TtgA [Paraburkholderia ultramafica]|uniref:Toluene efflux pump periplasmic linker protein TtgA n=2 Tax=Paraburkholderia ultramafica TaxID=1544867 RepID=A0A6S7BHU6_9BURK|nr:Toluene efflux pump periplasmic linker protein TtgA [Paraburkholderia ultramafica]